MLTIPSRFSNIFSVDDTAHAAIPKKMDAATIVSKLIESVEYVEGDVGNVVPGP